MPAKNTADCQCRQKTQRQQGRDANRRHQQSQEGRLDHRDRQRDYRERCRRRVTDDTSPAPSGSDSIVTAEPFRSEDEPGSVSGEDRYATSAEFEPACIICGRTVGSGARQAALISRWALTNQKKEKP